MVDDHRNFRKYITHRLEQILRAENAYASFKSKWSTRFDRKVDTFQLLARLIYYLSQVQLFVESFAVIVHCENQIFSKLLFITVYVVPYVEKDLVNSTLSFFIRCRPELEDLSSEDEAVATDLDMHALILSSSTDTHSPEEPLKTAEEVLREIDDIMQV